MMGILVPTHGSGWRAASALVTLYNQVNQQVPAKGRDTSDDAFVGDLSHQSRASDHNPNSLGVVCALDLTNDPRKNGGFNADNFFDLLLAKRDQRLKYFIHNRVIVSSTVSPWQKRRYTGENPHTAHIHISVGRGPDGRSSRPELYDDASAWDLNVVETPPPRPPEAADWSSGKASWFSQFTGQSKWVDTGDGRWNADRTIYLGPDNALGVPDYQQGVAFYNHHTLGRWFWVRAPNGRVLKLQQTDIGPAPWTGRKIDIAAAAAEQFGYTPTNFPTNRIFSWASA